MHGMIGNIAKWISPVGLILKVGKKIIDLLTQPNGSSLAQAVEYVVTSTNPLNSTALKSATMLAPSIANLPNDGILELVYPVLDEPQSLKTGKAVQKGNEAVTVYRLTVGNLKEACKSILQANEAEGKAKAGNAYSVTRWQFVPLADVPNNDYSFGNEAKARAKKAGGVFDIATLLKDD